MQVDDRDRDQRSPDARQGLDAQQAPDDLDAVEFVAVDRGADEQNRPRFLPGYDLNRHRRRRMRVKPSDLQIDTVTRPGANGDAVDGDRLIGGSTAWRGRGGQGNDLQTILSRSISAFASRRGSVVVDHGGSRSIRPADRGGTRYGACAQYFGRSSSRTCSQATPRPEVLSQTGGSERQAVIASPTVRHSSVCSLAGARRQNEARCKNPRSPARAQGATSVASPPRFGNRTTEAGPDFSIWSRNGAGSAGRSSSGQSVTVNSNSPRRLDRVAGGVSQRWASNDIAASRREKRRANAASLRHAASTRS